MSFYVEYNSIAGKERPFGEHRRAIIYNGVPDYDNIIPAEASGEHINRVSNAQEEIGKLLVMGELFAGSSCILCLRDQVSAKDELQDHLTAIVRKYVDQGVSFRKVEFQPS
jgi:hypothetical protein